MPPLWTAVVAVEAVPDIGENALHVPKEGLAAAIQHDAAAIAVEQGVAEVGLQKLDAVGDGGGSDFEFPGGPGKTPLPGGGLEKAQTLKRWKRRQEGTPHVVSMSGSVPPCRVLPPSSVGEMTLRLYAALNYSQNSAHDLRRTVNGA